MKLKEMHLTDFKGVKEATYSFGDQTKIMAANGLGKTTIATAWYWLWADKDYELHSNPNIRPDNVEECIPRVELVLEIDGAEVSAAKQQKRTVSKPDDRGVSKVTLTNTYEINSVPKTERDFKAYFEDLGIRFDKFLPLSHPEVFTGQKAGDMRKLLFSMAESKSDYDVAKITEGCGDVAELLLKYKCEEIEAMHKASKRKSEEQVKAIPNQIIGLEKAKVDIDTAELELQKRTLETQISDKETSYHDIDKEFESYQKASDGILELRMEINEFARKVNEGLVNEKIQIHNQIAEVRAAISAESNKLRMAHLSKDKFVRQAESYEKERLKAVQDWKDLGIKKFDESKWIFNPSSTI